MKRSGFELAAAAAVMLVSALMTASGAASASLLGDEDCGKCHPSPASDIDLSGAAHREVECSGCHTGHPPKSAVTIPRCGECHEGEAHFNKTACRGCHANAHMPLRIVMSSGNSAACRECHAAQVALIDRGGSLHSEMSCSGCHDAHRQVPECLDCHDPHAVAEGVAGCTGCHNPHMPLPASFGTSVSDRDCAPCHRDPFELLRANTTGHARRSCVSCHERRHGILPRCAQCHGLPHRISDKALFADCGECHGTAHDLHVWPGGNP